MESDNKTYADCILALRKKAVDTEDNKKGCCPLRRIAASLDLNPRNRMLKCNKM